MRFLFGLIIGAALTLVGAPLLGSMTAAHLEPLRQQAGAAMAELVDRTVEPQPAEPVSLADHVTEPDSTHSTETQVEQLPLPPVPADASILAPVPVIDDSPTAMPILTELAQDQAAWVPFRSELSARGFAGMLTRELGRPFQVMRAGPGQYLVVFAYQDESDRSSVLNEIRSLTGYALL